MRAGEIAHRVENLVAQVRSRLRRKTLAPDARHSEHFERRSALIFEGAGAAAPGVERIHRLIAARQLEAEFVDHPRRADTEMRQREHQVAALEYGPAAACHVSAERLYVLVEIVCPVDTRGQRVTRVQLVIDLCQKLIRADVVRHMAGLNLESGAAEYRGRRTEILPEERDVVRVVN